jgi:CDP-paratose 2-epimerase
MKILITGACGFVGGVLAEGLSERLERLEIIGIDNLSRPGSERNRRGSKSAQIVHGDVRNLSDLEGLPKVDWVIDAAANPSVLAGVTAGTTSRQLMEHNLVGTLNLLEVCKRHGSGLILLSTSRVYSLARLCALPMGERDGAFVPKADEIQESGFSAKGMAEGFSTAAPLSLYGSAKLASEVVSFEYGCTFGFPVFVNRCGVLAGAGQFGKADQGIFSYWIHSYRARRPLKYIGFNGLGHQVRDCLHPRDLASLLAMQLKQPAQSEGPLNVSGGMESSMSLAQLSRWCAKRFGQHSVEADPKPRPFDVPWLVLDSSRAKQRWDWEPTIGVETILEEIAEHANGNPQWLELSATS